MLTPEQESAGNSSKENQQNCHLVIKLLQFLVILAACLVELVFPGRPKRKQFGFA